MDWYYEMGGMYDINGNKIFGRKIYINDNDIDKLEKTRNKFKNTDVYRTAFKYNNENQNESDLIGPLYFDLDGEITDEESYEKIRDYALRVLTYLNMELNIEKKYIQIYFSGNKGFHFIIPDKVLGLQPCKDLNEQFKLLAMEMDSKLTIDEHFIDIKIYDKKRLLRLPHSINAKTGLYKIPLYESTLRVSTLETMRDTAKTDKIILPPIPTYCEKAAKAFKNKIDSLRNVKTAKRNNMTEYTKYFEMPECVKQILEMSIPKGSRNNTLVAVASSILQSNGNDIDAATDLLLAWNENNDPPMAVHEVVATINSASSALAEGRKYGCTSIKDLGYCLGDKCNLFKRR